MTTAHTFNGPDGMAKKIRLLASNCETAMAGLSRTLLLAVSAPDPVSTPDSKHADPRGVRIQTLDKGMTNKDIATLLGTVYGMLDTIEDEYSRVFGDDFREAVDQARGTHGHGQRMTVVPVIPMDTKPWKIGVSERRS